MTSNVIRQLIRRLLLCNYCACLFLGPNETVNEPFFVQKMKIPWRNSSFRACRMSSCGEWERRRLLVRPCFFNVALMRNNPCHGGMFMIDTNQKMLRVITNSQTRRIFEWRMFFFPPLLRGPVALAIQRLVCLIFVWTGALREPGGGHHFFVNIGRELRLKVFFCISIHHVRLTKNFDVVLFLCCGCFL